MYSRSYADESDSILIPDGYGGTALPLGVHNENINTEEPDEQVSGEVPADKEESVSTGAFSGLFSKLSLGNLTKLFPFESFGIKKFGTEEILILAVAAFLLFSRDGDVECAIMLILLLFIN